MPPRGVEQEERPEKEYDTRDQTGGQRTYAFPCALEPAHDPPVQIDIGKKVFSPAVDEVLFAKKVIEAIPDGRGVHMIDGKMQDDATWKQCQVMVSLARQLAEKDPG